ncbi:MAG: ABC transporter ATP-binding protein [Campylobacterota bacterium]|nr:ABC transporter ATP-binding protein [Campylobacterota bacterium]
MTNPILQAKGLNKQYGALKVCQNFNLDVQKNTLHALIGPNGAGKTTALNLLTGLILPDSGSVVLNNQDITNKKVNKRSQLGLARVFQITSLFNDFTVRQNLMLAAQAHQKSGYRFWTNVLKDKKLLETADEFLEKMGLTQRANILAGNLSHGERRQLEMGMALATRPEVLLLDEPMAGLGPGGSSKLSELILSLKGEITILLVEHDTHAVFSLADTVSVLVQGEVIATDTAEVIKNDLKVQEAYLGGASC